MLSPVDAYALWADHWDSTPSPLVALEARAVEPWLGDVRGKTFLDVGCGTGRWLSWARERGANAIGVDLSLEMLAQAERKPGLAGRLALADARELPVARASAGIVVCALMLGHAPDPARVVAEMARVAQPGAAVIVSDFHPEATRRGWRRTFTRGGKTYAIESHVYTPAELARADLVLEEVGEPHIGEPERSIFEAAGKPFLYEEASSMPALLLIRWRRR